MSWPQQFLDTISYQLGDAYPAFVNSLETTAPVSIRLNRGKLKARLGLEEVPWHKAGYYLDQRPVFTLDPLFHAGTYYVQEASSMFLAHAFDAVVPNREDLTVLDMCGAPGGKSTLLASLLPEDGLLLSNEVIRSRANILVENIQKWGHPQVVVSNNDPKDFDGLQGFFDVLVVDAPCSGEGLFRRDPKAAAEWSPSNVRLCVERQRRILMDSWGVLKPGGILIYSTCTYNMEENEGNMSWLLKEVDAESIEVPIEDNWQVVKDEVNGIWGYRFFPHRTRGEGLFMAVMRKGEEGRSFKRKKSKRPVLERAGKGVQMEVRSFLSENQGFEFFTYQDQLVAFSQKNKDKLETLERELKILHRGIPIGEMKKKNLVPDHALAMSPLLNRGLFDEVALDHEESLHFLSRGVLKKDLSKGWKLFSFEGHPLGWGKSVNNRINNYYPQHWRIRMAIPAEDTWYSLKQHWI